MPDLTPSDFPAFFTALWGYDPFPWQRRLAAQVCREGRWPAALDLPTAAGKTAAVDIAVFNLALEADKPVRRAPMRTVYVVDRRLVVDSTWQRASAIAAKLDAAFEHGDSGILGAVAGRLWRLAGGDQQLRRAAAASQRRVRPLEVARLRGGMPRENDWARSPTQPLVVCSTVDQAGSRLLFRGYGVSDRIQPVHAGLLGSDALWLLDEAHLARPLTQTLRAIGRLREPPWVEQAPLAPLAVVELSATRRDDEDDAAEGEREPPFRLDAEDEANDLLRQRLQASKPARLVPVGKAGSAGAAPAAAAVRASSDPAVEAGTSEAAPSDRVDAEAQERKALVSAYVEEAVRLAEIVRQTEPASVVGVVVNRVKLAREIADALLAKVQPGEQAQPSEPATPSAAIAPESATASNPAPNEASAAAAGDETRVELIIGPSRPLEREEQLIKLLPRMRAQDRQNKHSLYVVATQTIEVGADLDFDALVTQIAPLDALRQRFGRLNRLGTPKPSPAAILATKDEVAKGTDDPVYGAAAAATWEWLSELAKASAGSQGRGRGSREQTVDFGIASLDERLAALKASEPGRLKALTKDPADAPILFPSYAELWAQTSPLPAVDPEPALFLHGPEPGSPNVTILWRCDIPVGRDADEKAVAAIIDALPPSPLEGVQVSLAEARRWLAGEASGNIGDVEGDKGEGAEHRRARRGVWRWNGETYRWLSGGNQPLSPGDVLIARADDGGCDKFGWNPLSAERVRDWGERAALRQRRQLVLRLQRAALEDELHAEERGDESSAVWSRVKAVVDEHAADSARVLIASLQTVPGLPPRWGAYLAAFGGAGNARAVEVLDVYGEDLTEGLVLRLRHRLSAAEADAVAKVEQAARPAAAREDGSEGRENDEFANAGQTAVTDDEDGAGSAHPVPLDQHVAGVERYARQFAAAAGLPPEIKAAVVLAAHLHDTGKEERRFQAFLRGGDLWLAGGAPLAKSGRQWSRAESERIRRRIGLPAQARHECWSVRLAEQYLAQVGTPDIPGIDYDAFVDLVRWLVGTHHGYGRPFFPPVVDANAEGELHVRVPREEFGEGAAHPSAGTGETAASTGSAATLELCADIDHGLTRLDAGWADLFARLLRRYGPWELARLETILRLADHRASSDDQKPEKEARG